MRRRLWAPNRRRSSRSRRRRACPVSRAFRPFRLFFIRLGRLHCQKDLVLVEVDTHDPNLHMIAGFDDFARILDETAGKLRDVNESVVVNTDVDEGAEVRDIGHDAGADHAGLEVRDLADVLAKRERYEAFARIATGPGQLDQNVLESKTADLFLERAFPAQQLRSLPQQIRDALVQARRERLDRAVALRMNAGVVERMLAACSNVLRVKRGRSSSCWRERKRPCRSRCSTMARARAGPRPETCDSR
jgi:hypothetical protein